MTNDGPQAKEPYDEEEALLNTRLEEEQEAWNQVGMNVASWSPTPMYMYAFDQAILRILEDKLGISEKEADKYFKKELLKIMEKVRLDNQDQVAEARRRASMLLPPNLNGQDLLGPDGQPLGIRLEKKDNGHE